MGSTSKVMIKNIEDKNAISFQSLNKNFCSLFCPYWNEDACIHPFILPKISLFNELQKAYKIACFFATIYFCDVHACYGLYLK